MATAAAVTPPQPRQRTRSMLSFTSKKSAGSQRSVSSPRKIDLTETSAEKSKNRIKTKADPTLAMNEEQPCKQELSSGCGLRLERDRSPHPWRGKTSLTP